MRWGVELWDRFEEVSNYVHKGIEFSERFEEFLKKRCSIENSYAKNLRKLIDSFEPKQLQQQQQQQRSTAKQRDDELEERTHVRAFMKMLGELRDVAGQHELIAENYNEKVLSKLNQTIKALKEERRRCIDDNEKFYQDHQTQEELLDKAKSKYERAFRECEKADEQLYKVENDDSASKNDIKKQKNVCEQKKRIFDALGADYAKQLGETNQQKNMYYTQQLPVVFDSIQQLEQRRVDEFKEYMNECVQIEVEVLPRIRQCLNGIEQSAQLINSQTDTNFVVDLFKTGYDIPADHQFDDLNEKKKSQFNQMNNSFNSNGSNPNQMYVNNSSTSTLPVNVTQLNSTSAARNKKYRTLNKIKGLFLTSSSSSNGTNGHSHHHHHHRNGTDLDALFDLPPQQLKNELNKKILSVQNEIEKQQKEREGLIKLKDIYCKNVKFGDSQSAELALKANEEKIQTLNNQLRKYKETIEQLEMSRQNNQTSSNYSSEYSSSSNSGGGCDSGERHIYQSPSDHSVNNSCSPSTPQSAHYHMSTTNGQTNINKVSSASANLNQNTVAYVMSPLNNLNKSAPLVNCNNNESFDDEIDDDDDDDDEENYEDDTNKENKQKDNTMSRQNTTIISQYQSSHLVNNTNKLNGTQALKTTTSTAATSTIANENGIAQYSECQYDHIDSYVQQANGSSTHIEHQQHFEDVVIGTALVIYAFNGSVQNAMSIQENESLSVLERDSGDGWTLVKRLNGEKGYVPTDYIRIVYY